METSQNSTETKDLIAALAKARLEFKPLTKNATVSYSGRKYEYVDLAWLLECITPALSKNGLVLTHRLDWDNGTNLLVSTLWHTSGQHISSRSPLNPEDKSMQKWGGAITYMRRYHVQALCSISGEEDDDDAAATAIITKKEYHPQPNRYEPSLSDDRLAMIERELALIESVDEMEKLQRRILARYQKERLEQIPNSKFEEVIEGIRKNKENLRQAK